jgi:Lon protease-like protein
MMINYPKIIPVFPLSGIIYFPKTNLPLNIFEQRYLNLVNDAYNKDRLMGMVQSKREDDSIYNIGCLGKISDYQKSKDGRILINLTGITRFEILEEKNNNKLYREFSVNYKNFENDLSEENDQIKTTNLIEKAKIFFKKSGLLLNWKEFERLDQNQRINTLAMIAPISNEEKQKILEAITVAEKIFNLEEIINFYLHEVSFDNQTIQ